MSVFRTLRFALASLLLLVLWCVTPSALAEINQVRVVNDTDEIIYVHKGGYAPSVRIEPGKWQIFKYPFQVVPPGESKKEDATLLAATSGGRWMTTPNGVTYLSKPKLMICLDYGTPKNIKKTGNRVWTIKKAEGRDKDCKVKSYRQPWFQSGA